MERNDHCTHPNQAHCDCDWCRVIEHGSRDGAPRSELTPAQHGKLKAQREKHNAAARAKRQAYSDLGMKRVRGAQGGIYYE